MVEVVWTIEALAWLQEIHDYIMEDNPSAAERVLEGIVSRAEQLASFPELGGLLRIQGARALRMLLYGHYRIVYRVIDRQRVEIIGVYHTALDITRWLPPASEKDTIHE